MEYKDVKKLITIVCCYNDEQQYKEFCESLYEQEEAFDLIGIDNREKEYSSCAKAFNSVLKDIKTEYVIFSHQDILIKNDELKKFVAYLKDVETFDIVGVAGAATDAAHIYSNILDTNNNYMSKYRVHDIQEVETLDECFFGGTTKCFRKYPFDERVCNNWHLYAADRCLNAKMNNHHVYVCDISLIHKSYGKTNYAFICNFYKLCKKYSKEMKQIKTTCGISYTNVCGRVSYYFLNSIKLMLRNMFK